LTVRPPEHPEKWSG